MNINSVDSIKKIRYLPIFSALARDCYIKYMSPINNHDSVQKIRKFASLNLYEFIYF